MTSQHVEQAIPSWCPILKVDETLNDLRVQTAVIASTVKDIKQDVGEVKAHQVKQNGAVVALQSDALKAEGALAVLRWLVTILLALMSIGVAIAGVILAQGR